MKAAFVVVNYNQSRITVGQVASIRFLENSDSLAAIVVVDNGSAHEDLAFLKNALADIPGVIIVPSETNLGYSGGMNLGLRYLKNHGIDCDYVIAGNNDILFDRDFLTVLASRAYPREAFVVVPDVITLTGRHQNPQRYTEEKTFRDRVLRWRMKNYFFFRVFEFLYARFGRKRAEARGRIVDPSRPVLERIALPIGALFVFTRGYLESCGTLEEIIFLWNEEPLLAEQVRRAGGEIWLDRNLRCLHFESVTVGKMTSRRMFRLYRESQRRVEAYLSQRA